MGSGLVMMVLGVLGDGELWRVVGAGFGSMGTTGLARFSLAGIECLLCLGGDPKGMGLFSPGMGLWLNRSSDTGLFLGRPDMGTGLLGTRDVGIGLSRAGLMMSRGTGLSRVGGTRMAGLWTRTGLLPMTGLVASRFPVNEANGSGDSRTECERGLSRLMVSGL